MSKLETSFVLYYRFRVVNTTDGKGQISGSLIFLVRDIFHTVSVLQSHHLFFIPVFSYEIPVSESGIVCLGFKVGDSNQTLFVSHY